MARETWFGVVESTRVRSGPKSCMRALNGCDCANAGLICAKGVRGDAIAISRQVANEKLAVFRVVVSGVAMFGCAANDRLAG